MSPIDESEIRMLVERFYGRVRADPQLGPIFAARLDGRWPAHLDKMVDFWSSALLRTGRYAGNPRAAHAAIEGLTPGHFVHWLALFDSTLKELFDPPAVAYISRLAHAMARGLQSALPSGRRSLPLTEVTDEQAHPHPT